MTQLVLYAWAAAITLIAALRPRWLLATAILMSAFEGAALFKAGGTAISPYTLVTLCVAGRCLLTRVSRQDVLGRTPAVRQAMTAAVALAVVGVGGAIVLPRVFAGASVLSPRLSSVGDAPLSLSSSNVGQAIYLALNVGLLWWAGRQDEPASFARSALTAVVAAGAVVVGIALYQLAASVAGLPFPDDLLYSNDGFVFQSGTIVADMPRISSTFTEPAGMAVLLVGFVALLSEPVGAVRPAWRVPLLVLAVGVLLVSTSSTAYVGLMFVGAWRLVAAIATPLLTGRPAGKRIAITLLGLLAVAAAFAASPSLRDLATKMVLEKDQSASYGERHGADTHSWTLAARTFGLGAGIGSNRASSFLPSLLSTLGVWGAGLLAFVVFALIRRPLADSMQATQRALAAGLVGVIATKCVSSPDLNTPFMWALMAALVAVHAVPAVMPVAAKVEESETPVVPSRRRFVTSALSPTGATL